MKKRVYEISATVRMFGLEELTEAQVKTILEETGDVLEAERITIRELEAP